MFLFKAFNSKNNENTNLFLWVSSVNNHFFIFHIKQLFACSFVLWCHFPSYRNTQGSFHICKLRLIIHGLLLLLVVIYMQNISWLITDSSSHYEKILCTSNSSFVGHLLGINSCRKKSLITWPEALTLTGDCSRCSNMGPSEARNVLHLLLLLGIASRFFSTVYIFSFRTELDLCRVPSP